MTTFSPKPSDQANSSMNSTSNNAQLRPDRSLSQRAKEKETHRQASKEEMMGAVETMLLGVGEDPEREGLLKTPKRVAEAMRFLTSGYQQSLEDLVNNAIFDEGHDEMVLVRDIDAFSLCEASYVALYRQGPCGIYP